MMNFMLKYRVWILVVLLVSTVAIGINLRHLTRDAGISALVPEDHPDYIYSREMEKIFGAVDQVVIGISAQESVYTPDALGFIHELTRFFENLEEIDEDDVISLTNIDDIQGENGTLLIEPLLDLDALETLDEQTLSAVRDQVRANPLFYGKLVSQDERHSVVIAGVSWSVSMKEERVAALRAKIVAQLAELHEKYPAITINFSGPAMLKAVISEHMQQDMRLLFPIAILVVTLMLFFLLRSLFGMLAPIMVTLFSVLWTFGLKGLVGSPLTIVETSIPVVLIAIGCADGIHIISEFFGFYRKGYAVNDALTETMRLLTLPVILTSVTTALGFISLLTAPGVSIKNMGLYLSFGVMVAMVFSLFFIPTLTSFYRQRKPQPAPERRTSGVSDERLPPLHLVAEAVGKQVVRHHLIVSGAAIIILIVSILGIINIQVESDEVRYFRASNAFRVATEHIQEDLGGIASLDIIVEGGESDLLKQPKLLHAIEDLQRFCEQDDLVSYSLSLVDLLKRINYVLHDQDPAYDRLPRDVEQVQYETYEEVNGAEVLVQKTEAISGFEQVAQFLLLYDMSGGDVTEQYVDDAYQIGRISVRLKDMSSRRLERLLEKIQPYIAEHFPKEIAVRYSNHYIRIVMMGLIIDSQIYSLITVLITITILMTVIFRSVIVGLLTSLPVFIAVLFNFAVMWMLGVTLNVGTSIVASVGMGVGIDYAIHYYARFRFVFRELNDYDAALIRTIAETSRPILSNASAVGLGFLVLLFSEYQVIGNIGWITALSMFTTACSSLIVLPAMLSLVKPTIK